MTISACALAQDIVIQAQSWNDVLGLLFEAGQIIVYLSAVGILTFDIPRVREAKGTAADLLRIVYGLPFLTSYLSGLAAALVGILQSAIIGQFNPIVQAFIENMLPVIFREGRLP